MCHSKGDEQFLAKYKGQNNQQAGRVVASHINMELVIPVCPLCLQFVFLI